ncbi:MAG: hypothetical protein KF749_04810 [Bacteroidetes bacterium]|nr:hypothetical protein [Bacteroidota bacterium]MCW5895410.1 hypothetical protein [Bacteroidota bacterium]
MNRLKNRINPAQLAFPVLLASALLLFGCSSSSESVKIESVAPPVATKEMLYKHGHQLYLLQQFDSARTVLQQALALDANDRDVLADLASLHYDLGMAPDAGNKKRELLRQSRDYYVKLEALGVTDSDTYERICEVSNAVSDNKTLLKYARKNADKFPYDRQFYNLSYAYFSAEDYNSVIRVCKDAIEKFKSSPFIGSFYRQMGRAYMKVDRDQTAERTFYAGLKTIDAKIADVRKNPDSGNSADISRMKDDKIGILTSLKLLHTTYKAADKLADVEKKLRELGK